MKPSHAQPPRAARDPQRRRQTLVKAAAAEILESGVNGLTHRKVAARAQVPLGATTQYFATLAELRAAGLDLLATTTDHSLAEVKQVLAAASNRAAALAGLLHAYFGDPRRVRADTAFYVVSSQDPTMRPLATRWFNGLTQILTDYTEPDMAQAAAVFADGAMLHAALHDTPLSEAMLTATFTQLIGGGPRAREHHR